MAADWEAAREGLEGEGALSMRSPADSVAAVTLHQPWYLREKKDQKETLEAACFYGCDSEVYQVVLFCETCSIAMCQQCSDRHASDKRSAKHPLIPVEEMKMSYLKASGWNVPLISLLGLDEMDTINNLSRNFQALTDTGKCEPKGNMAGSSARVDQHSPRELADGETSPRREHERSFDRDSRPDPSDFLQPPSHPLGPLFRNSSTVARQTSTGSVGSVGNGSQKSRKKGMKEDPLETLDLLGSNLEPNSKIGTSFEWEPVDKDGNLTNFFEVVTAPDMQKPNRNPWGAVKTRDCLDTSLSATGSNRESKRSKKGKNKGGDSEGRSVLTRTIKTIQKGMSLGGGKDKAAKGNTEPERAGSDSSEVIQRKLSSSIQRLPSRTSSTLPPPPPVPKSPRNPWSRQGRETGHACVKAVLHGAQSPKATSPRRTVAGNGKVMKSRGDAVLSSDAHCRASTSHNSQAGNEATLFNLSSSAHVKIQESLNKVPSMSNVKRGLLYVEYLLGAEPVCCFCEVADKHLLIAPEHDPGKIMFKIHFLEFVIQACEVSCRRMVLCSTEVTEHLRTAYASAGVKRRFDSRSGRCILVAKDQNDRNLWLSSIRERARELTLRKKVEERYDSDDLRLVAFECRVGQHARLSGLSRTGPLRAFNGKSCIIQEITSDKLKVNVGARDSNMKGTGRGPMEVASTMISVKPENLGAVIYLQPLSDAGRQRLQDKIAQFMRLLATKYSGEDVEEEDEESGSEQENDEDQLGQNSFETASGLE